MLLDAALGRPFHDSAAYGVVAKDLVRVDDVESDAPVPGQIPILLAALDDVDDDVVAVGGHPRLSQLG